jgi:hypothetical protein
LAKYPALKPWFPSVVAGEWASYWVFANWTLALTVQIAALLTVLYVLYVVCFCESLFEFAFCYLILTYFVLLSFFSFLLL